MKLAGTQNDSYLYVSALVHQLSLLLVFIGVLMCWHLLHIPSGHLYQLSARCKHTTSWFHFYYSNNVLHAMFFCVNLSLTFTITVNKLNF